jgi:type II secretion system protein J
MMPLPNNTRSPRGFTLIEMLISVSIFSILMVSIHAVFFTALRLRNTASDSLEATLPVEEALNVMQRDIANVVASTNGVFIGPLQSINQTNTLPDQIGPDFYTTGGELDGMVPWGNIQKVDYLLSTPTNGIRRAGRDLIRAVTRNLLPLAQPAQPDEKHALLTGVENLTFLYYDGTSWQPTWDTTQVTNLPRGIKVQIRMATQPGATPRLTPLELVVPMDVLLNTNPVTGQL